MDICNVCNSTLFKTRRGTCSNCDEIESKRISNIYDENTLRLCKDIPYLDESNYIVDYDFSKIEALFERYAKDYDGFEENPDFQRGHVWSREQQIKYVEAFVSNILSEQQRTITLNCPDFKGGVKAVDSDLQGFVIIDGLQRYTASVDFCKGKFKIFGKYSYEDLLLSRFSLKRKTFKVQVYSYQYKKDLLKHYLLFNAGGVVHSNEEINRVKKMLDELT